jgi:hypothetical protein
LATFEGSKKPERKKKKRRYNDIEVVCIFLSKEMSAAARKLSRKENKRRVGTEPSRD